MGSDVRFWSFLGYFLAIINKIATYMSKLIYQDNGLSEATIGC